MIKILASEQIKALDQFTIEHEPITSIDLMERASRGFVTWFTQHFNALNKVGIICGPGNNGGDGLAIARMLRDWGYPVKVWIVNGDVPESADFKINYTRLQEEKIPCTHFSSQDKEPFQDRDILIDGIFGYGLSRPAEGIFAEAIVLINASDAVIIAIDMPSGLMADKPSSGAIVAADYSVSFQVPKLSFFFPEYHRFVGHWILLDIGLSKEYIKSLDTMNFFLTLKGTRRLLKKRNKFDHKGTFGHALLVAGSYGKMGAAVLAAKAVLRSGVGLLSIYAPKCGYDILQTSVPEAMVLIDPDQSILTSPPSSDKYTVLGIGPGIGTHPDTVNMLRQLLQNHDQPMVVDADALNILSQNRELLHLIPKGSILTPHPKEFERLVGEWKNDFERMDKQKNLAAQLQSVIVLKGAYTSIATPGGKFYFNSTGNPGMASGGTGDVLTGILTGILAQNYSAENAAVLGVYLHGAAGDLVILEKGMESLIASDVIDFLPAAFRQLKR